MITTIIIAIISARGETEKLSSKWLANMVRFSLDLCAPSYHETNSYGYYGTKNKCMIASGLTFIFVSRVLFFRCVRGQTTCCRSSSSTRDINTTLVV